MGISISPDGSKVYVGNYGDNSVSVINTASNTVLTTISVGNNPWGISVSPNGSNVYVANQGNISAPNNTVSVINTATSTVSATITVGTFPRGVSVSPDGNKVYVANEGDGTVSVINTASNTVSTTITVGGYPAAFGNFISTANVGIVPQSMVPAVITVYPNPVTDNLQIQTNIPIKNIEVTDITGRLLYTTTAKTINCSSFANGAYFIIITTENGKAVKKFVKE